MGAQEQNKLVNISKFVTLEGHNNECYINPKYIVRIFKPLFSESYGVCYRLEIGESFISLHNVKTKQELNKFLDYIYNK